MCLKKLHQRGITFRFFPGGTCGAVSDLLGQYLRQAYGLDARYVCGLRDGQQSHAWVRVDDVIVDITADQFEDGMPPVAVASPDNEWHAAWHKQTERQPDAGAYALHSMWEAFVEGMAIRGNSLP